MRETSCCSLAMLLDSYAQLDKCKRHFPSLKSWAGKASKREGAFGILLVLVDCEGEMSILIVLFWRYDVVSGECTVKNGVYIYPGCRYIYYKTVYIPMVRCI